MLSRKVLVIAALVAVIAGATSALVAGVAHRASAPVVVTQAGVPAAGEPLVVIAATAPRVAAAPASVAGPTPLSQLPSPSLPGVYSLPAAGPQAPGLSVTSIPSQRNPDGSLPAVTGTVAIPIATGTDVSSLLSNQLTESLIAGGFQNLAAINSVLGSIHR